MNKVIFIGDSLTWGENPNTQRRYRKEARWTSIVEETIKERIVLGIGKQGMAIEFNSNEWAKDGNGWFDSGHFYIEKILKSFEGELDDVFLFLGVNSFTDKKEGQKDLANLYQDLIDSIRSKVSEIKNIYIMLLPDMPGVYSPAYSISQVNEELKKLNNVDDFVDLTNIHIRSEDNTHFSEANNKQFANEVLKFIKNKGEYK